MAHIKHYDNLGTARFITFSCYHRYPLLTSKDAICRVLQQLEAHRRKYEFSILGYVIMPSHVHLVMHSEENLKVGSVIGEIKKVSAFKIISQWKKENNKILSQIRIVENRRQTHAFWLPRCYDHNCRSPKVVREKIVYCHNNPVMAELVCDPGKWQWSSYGWYMGDRSGIVHIDEFEL